MEKGAAVLPFGDSWGTDSVLERTSYFASSNGAT